MTDSPVDQAPAGVIRTLRELPRAAIVLLFGIALNRMGSFVALFLVLYLTGIGYSPAQAGLVLTGFGAGSILGTFAGGSATGRFGARTVIIWSMVLCGVATAGLAAVTAFVPLLAVGFAAGAFGQMYRPAAATMLADLTPPQRLVMASAASRFGLNVGAAIGPLLGVWLAAAYSYPVVFAVNAVVSLLFAVVVLLVIPARAGRRGAAAGGDAAIGDAAIGGDADAPESTRARYRDLLRDRRFLLFLAGMFVTAVAEVQYQSTLPLEVQQSGYPTALYGAVVALNGALVILVELPLTTLIQRFSMRATVAAGCLLLGVGLGLFGLPFGPWIFVVGAVVWTMGEIISAPSIGAYPALAAPTPALRSRYIGALSTCQTAGWAVGPSIGTALFQYVGGAVWVMCAGLGVLACLGMWAGVRDPDVR
ncbi:MFS transporter [Nonomuraea gerenzanensis]|uniref:Major facilitator superfamily MFS_1 transporter n=1 Tax=Nonomuraea gerenzanensis TaxID=93944 RepID=A0A1M4EM20_9ACTN|nr:MFS transporter [Nonomuraea gerenzanensis]UBU11406.1 MFS transporter [Nonomuraea gerenzanensis]SBO99889.1 major facilitator superfamily MFS_1 transporter [Nonomuraea gerenzanensis]